MIKCNTGISCHSSNSSSSDGVTVIVAMQRLNATIVPMQQLNARYYIENFKSFWLTVGGLLGI